MPRSNATSKEFPSFPLVDLHAHLGASVSPTTYWEIAHEQGFKLPERDYHRFIEYITLSDKRKMGLKEYFDTIYHPLLDPLSSGTFACETATFEIMSGAYRSSGISLIELRNNPMKHNHGGQEDLDHIIMAMLRGMEKALLQYPTLRAGLIFCMDRQFSFEKNAIIVEKAIKYRRRGVVGIDLANYYPPKGFSIKNYRPLIQRARRAGLKITIHSGENADSDDLWEVVEYLQPDRIGHGIRAAYDKKLMKRLIQKNIVLEVCPMSNIATKAVENFDELSHCIKTLKEHKVRFTINTDWPEMIEEAHLNNQFAMLRKQNILNESDLRECVRTSLAATFVPKGGLNAYL
ncbi:adenosine deaminase [Candidatus Uhrbacteria bacterium]|nr:adenosine deaminase [Candidatus Uhrbacteria bacterium]